MFVWIEVDARTSVHDRGIFQSVVKYGLENVGFRAGDDVWDSTMFGLVFVRKTMFGFEVVFDIVGCRVRVEKAIEKARVLTEEFFSRSKSMS